MVATNGSWRLWLLMAELVMDHKSLWREHFEQSIDLPFSRYRAMRRIASRPRTQRELADLMGVDAPAASVIVSDLVRRGLVQRQSHPEDGRVKIIEITSAGQKWLENVRDLPGGPPEMFDALSQAERRELTKILNKLRKSADS